MKLANEIAERISPMIRPKLFIDEEPAQAYVEKMIAAKLEPIRENAKSLEYIVIADDIALSYLRPILAMLSEDA